MWNVRTLLDNTKAHRPERRTALVAKELSRYNVDIATLSETCFADKGQLTEHGGGHAFFWRGHSTTERREAGIGFAIRSHLARKLAKLPESINDRLMSLQLPLENKKSMTLISAYSPTMTNPENIKDKFYEELDALIAAIPQLEKLFILGDFNARVGTDHQTLEGIIGRHGNGKCNSNGLLLLKLCETHDLTLTNTLFPRSRHWHLFDYVITRKRDVQDVRETRAMCGADCWTDHRLIVSKCKLCILPKRRPQGQKSANRLNVSKLKNSNIAQEFARDLDDRLPDTPQDEQDSTEEQWTAFREVVYSAALEHLGPATRKHQDWFDENDVEIQALLSEKHQLFRAHQNDPPSRAKKDTFACTKSKVHSFPLLTADGTQLPTGKKQIFDRWAEHFNQVLNRPATINNKAIARLPQVEINRDLDNPPTEEISKAVKQLSCGKAPGSDAIPEELKDATMVHIYKRKGNRLRYSQQGWLMEDNGEVGLPKQVHHDRPTVP
ncbi:uncharacterized protein LOC125035191 [Penaeus chinensis]|uniref:uncharacterized protein LOC125035191 n=1 Tax=Penaeus chinensis TaxID=139456 RepID=UPI001FB744D1|nr:uncharacterized protein LOC125035191 [Penaeus chinensis]